MNPIVLIILCVLTTLALGLGIGLAFRLVPSGRRARRDLKAWENTPDAKHRERIAEDERQRRRLAFPAGRRRNSSVCGVAGELLRHTDGSYTRGYKLSLAHSAYDDDFVVEQRIDEIARAISGNFPPGTTFQFRLNVSPDRGDTRDDVIQRHVNSRGEDGTHPLASLLHASSIGFYVEAAKHGVFRKLMLSLWVRIPAKHANDRTGISTLLPSLGREFKRRGAWGFIKTLPSAWRRASDKRVVQRTSDDEMETMAGAGRLFKAIESEFPNDLQIKPMTREEIWDAVYRNHRQNAKSTPTLPDTPGLDVRDYLCGETIEGSGHFLLHGSFPVAVVSVFIPPQPVLTADSMRLLTANPSLNFRHVIITEYVCQDAGKAKKSLESAISQTKKTGNTLWGRKELKHDAQARLADLDSLLKHVEHGRETLTETRMYAVVYGHEARTREELELSVEKLDEACGYLISSIKKIPGADAEREEPVALRAMYLRSLVGECDPRPTGRELPETASSLAALVPTESVYKGSLRPHSVFVAPDGEMIGVDLYDRQKIKSPTVLITAASGEGKTVMGGRIINDCLSHKPHLKVSAVDYYRSLGPLVDLLHGRHIRYDEGNERSLNSWWYPGLPLGQYPDKLQLAYVQGDLRILGQVEKSDVVAKAIIKTIVEEVYKIAVPRNRPGLPEFEPTLTHFLDLLKRYQWKEESARRRAEDLYLALNVYRRDPLLDAPTHPDFKVDSTFDVFELDSLSALDESVRASVAYRIASQVMRTIGEKMPDGTYRPVLLVFDEMKEIIKHYPAILEVVEHATRMGRKEGVVTLLMSQAYEDFIGSQSEPNPIGVALAKNSGVKFIGKQIGGYDRLAVDCELAPSAMGAIRSIKNVPGQQSQWVVVIGSGTDKVVEVIQLNLSPAELWTFTTDTNERDARTTVTRLKPTWPLAVSVAWLAENYPKGLTGDNLIEIDTGGLMERMAA